MADSTSSIQASGGDYADPQLWQDDLDFDANDIEIGEMANEDFTDINLQFASVTGTPSATSYALLKTQAGAEALGIWDNGPRLIQSTSTTQHCIRTNIGFVAVQDFELKQDNTQDSSEGFRILLNGLDTLVDRMLIRTTTTTGDQDGFYHGPFETRTFISNTVIDGFDRLGINNQNFSASASHVIDVDHCTIINCGNGSGNETGGYGSRDQSSGANTVRLNNNISVLNTDGATAEDYTDRSNDSATFSGDDNIASDASIEGKTTNSHNSVTVGTAKPTTGENVVFFSTSSPADVRIKIENAFTVSQLGTSRVGSEPAPQVAPGGGSLQDFSVDIGLRKRKDIPTIGAFEYLKEQVPVYQIQRRQVMAGYIGR